MVSFNLYMPIFPEGGLNPLSEAQIAFSEGRRQLPVVEEDNYKRIAIQSIVSDVLASNPQEVREKNFHQLSSRGHDSLVTMIQKRVRAIFPESEMTILDVDELIRNHLVEKKARVN
jgi:hypothetical protein